MLGGSYCVSDIQDNIEYIITKHKTTAILHIRVYNKFFNKIYNRLLLKTKDGYKLKLKTPEKMAAQRKLIDKTKNGENIPSLEVEKVVLAQCNLVDN